MRLLLDTHAFIYLATEPGRLSLTAADAIADSSNTVLLSVVSVWEMVVKSTIGKLKFRQSVADLVEIELKKNRLTLVPVTLQDFRYLETLPLHHRDPFDRLLFAQAQIQNCRLVSRDAVAQQYGVDVLW